MVTYECMISRYNVAERRLNHVIKINTNCFEDLPFRAEEILYSYLVPGLKADAMLTWAVSRTW
jgi:hypothetical protein